MAPVRNNRQSTRSVAPYSPQHNTSQGRRVLRQLNLEQNRPYLDHSKSSFVVTHGELQLPIVGVPADKKSKHGMLTLVATEITEALLWPKVLREAPDLKKPLPALEKPTKIWTKENGKSYACPTCSYFPIISGDGESSCAIQIFRSPGDFGRRHCNSAQHKSSMEKLFGWKEGTIARKPFECEICSITLARPDRLSDHLEKKHNKKVTAAELQRRLEAVSQDLENAPPVDSSIPEDASNKDAEEIRHETAATHLAPLAPDDDNLIISDLGMNPATPSAPSYPLANLWFSDEPTRTLADSEALSSSQPTPFSLDGLGTENLTSILTTTSTQTSADQPLLFAFDQAEDLDTLESWDGSGALRSFYEQPSEDTAAGDYLAGWWED